MFVKRNKLNLSSLAYFLGDFFNNYLLVGGNIVFFVIQIYYSIYYFKISKIPN
jgi:hypothetical protein